jgi:predicted O-methyltransferase YrrM
MNDAFDLRGVPQTDPLEIYRYRDGLYAVDLLGAAICEFDFFTWLARRPSGLLEICQGLNLKERPVDVMLTLFTAEGWVRKVGLHFEVTSVAREHLVSSSPFFLGAYYASLKERPVLRDFVAILRTGRTASWGSFEREKPWSEAMLTEDFASRFTAAMDCRGFYLGPALAKAAKLHGRSRLLDIAGGSGIFACTMAAHYPGLSATVFERAPVDQIAQQMIQKRGYADRVTVDAGDMFVDPLPHGFDVHLYSNVIHDWDEPKVRQLLAASFAALAPGGVLLIHDAHLNADKTGPLPVAKYSALLMSVTEGKCYSVAEMYTMLSDAGFSEYQFVPTVADRSVIIAGKRAQ